MEELYQLVVERNHRETTPFLAIHEANATLLHQLDALQAKCEELERELLVQREFKVDNNNIDHHHHEGRGGTISQSAALRNETRLREKLEKLQEELNQKMKLHADDQASALELAKELSSNKDAMKVHEDKIQKLQEEIDRKDRAIEHMTNELNDAQARTKLAEQQYVGLKDTIRVLQEENDSLKKENRMLESRLVSDKEALVTEMNGLSELCEKLKKERDMLRSLKSDEEKRKTSSWFGLSSSSSKPDSSTPSKANNSETEDTRKYDPNMAVVLPTKIRQKITAHTTEASCVRYDGSGADLLATGSADSTVNVWDTATGTLRATLKSGTSNAIFSCDISNGVLVAGGSDKTCRVWNLKTQRMVHHLVGHAHKITSVRLFDNEKGVITASADRSLKVWDISRQTYRQTATLRHSSTANSVDVGLDSSIAVTGHLDGGIRFWDVRSGDRTKDISELHQGAVTSVQFHPTDTSKVLTNGMDSCIKLVDIRTSIPIQTFRDDHFQTSYSWSSAALSPDGKYVASGSSSNGTIVVWEVGTGKTVARLQGHEVGVCGFAWGRGGISGQQVASVDKKGTLILWA